MNLLTPSLMLGDCFATHMAGDEEKNTSADEYLTFVIIQEDIINFSIECVLIMICSNDCYALEPLRITVHHRVEILLERDARERAPPAYGSLFFQTLC